MRHTRQAAFIVLLTLLALAAGCVSRGDMSSVTPIAISSEPALAAINGFRAQNDLPPLAIDPRLMAASADQTNAMASRGVLDHDVAGRLPGRLTRAGYAWSATAENIGRGYADYPAAMAGWVGSPEHRRNLLNPRVTHVGFAGSADRRGNRNYWAQIFGAERVAPAAAGGATAQGGWWPPR